MRHTGRGVPSRLDAGADTAGSQRVPRRRPDRGGRRARRRGSDRPRRLSCGRGGSLRCATNGERLLASLRAHPGGAPMSLSTDLVQRGARNPILTPDDVPYPVATVHNPAAARLDDGRVAMVFRSHLASGRSILGLAYSDDGEAFEVQPEPWLVPGTVEPFATY